MADLTSDCSSCSSKNVSDTVLPPGEEPSDQPPGTANQRPQHAYARRRSWERSIDRPSNNVPGLRKSALPTAVYTRSEMIDKLLHQVCRSEIFDFLLGR